MLEGTTRTNGVRVVTILALLVAALALGAGCGGDDEEATGDENGAAAAGGTVAFLLPENVTARWEGQDRPFFVEALKKYAPNAKVIVSNALNDASKQQQQAEQALTQGAKVLVVIPVDQEAAAVIVNGAEDSDVPVIAYDRLIKDSPVDYYVSVDGKKIGEIQGEWLAENTEDGDNIAVINGSETDDNAHLFREGYMSVLQPLFDDGSRKKVADVWIPGWEPPKAQAAMEQILTRTNNDVQGVLSANDGMAAASIAALEAQGLAGKVPITGLDATTQALQLILQDKQGMTAWRSLREQADKAAQITAALLKGEEPSEDLFTGTVDNGSTEVPWATVEAHAIDKDSVQLVIEDGAATKAEVCKGVPAGTGPC